MAERVRTPWAVNCPNHGLTFLTQEEYDLQMSRPDDPWVCPICNVLSTWSDNNYETFYAEKEIIGSINSLCKECHDTSISKGWWEEGVDRNDGELIALMHSELSEALEALRHGNPKDDHLPEIDQIDAEMADTLIRIFDFCGARNINLGRALVLKMAYNKTRPHKHGGKKF